MTSKPMNEALKAVRNLAPQDNERMTGSYTAEMLGQMEASHLRLIEAAAQAMAYLIPCLYAHGALKRAVDQANDIRAKVGLS